VRHQKKGRKLNRHTKARKALFKNLLTSFFLNGFLTTTEAKAKAIKDKIDHLVSKAKSPNLVNRRFIYAYLTKPSAAAKLINEIAPKLAKRNGGYSRIIKLGTRTGDQAAMAKVELVVPLEKTAEEAKTESKKKSREETKEKASGVSKKRTSSPKKSTASAKKTAKKSPSKSTKKNDSK